MRVAIIPARGGSKRIPRKNIKDFRGKPMIAWSIEAAKASACFDKIIVSTDDDEIAEVARIYGAEVPFIRPDHLSDDVTGTIPVMRHAIQWLELNLDRVDYACCIYATAPFLSPRDLQAGLELINKSRYCYVFPVTSYAFPIQRAVRVSEHGCVAMFNPEQFQTRSQDLEEAWHDAGQFYWGTTKAWTEELPIFNAHSYVMKIPRWRVQDIDTPDDWISAELMAMNLSDRALQNG